MPFSSRYSQRLPPSPGSTSNSPFRQSRVLWEMCTRLHGSERPGPRARQQGAGRPRGRPPTPWSLSATSMRQEGDVLRLPRALRGVRNREASLDSVVRSYHCVLCGFLGQHLLSG